jgi:hypothetical protein
MHPENASQLVLAGGAATAVLPVKAMPKLLGEPLHTGGVSARINNTRCPLELKNDRQRQGADRPAA